MWPRASTINQGNSEIVVFIAMLVVVLPLQSEREQLLFEPLPSALQYIIHTKV